MAIKESMAKGGKPKCLNIWWVVGTQNHQELTSLFGAEAGDRTGPLGVLWGRKEVFRGMYHFRRERYLFYLSSHQPPEKNSLDQESGRNYRLSLQLLGLVLCSGKARSVGLSPEHSMPWL